MSGTALTARQALADELEAAEAAFDDVLTEHDNARKASVRADSRLQRETENLADAKQRIERLEKALAALEGQ